MNTIEIVECNKKDLSARVRLAPKVLKVRHNDNYPHNIMKYWKCNLCNIELPDDELATIRKQRHKEFHIDESVGTHKRRRNWTFGEVEYVLT